MTTADTLMDGLVAEVDLSVSERIDLQDGSEWREDPAELDHFVESEEHLNLPPLYPLQREAVVALLGDDPKLIFTDQAAPASMPLAWAKVKSSNVTAIGWHDDWLYVRFGANQYRYQGVNRTTFEKLLHAQSVGKALNAIKRACKVEKLKPGKVQIEVDGEGRLYQVAVLLWGKGSGKDYISSIVICYLVHVLLCLRNPQAFLNQAPGEPVDIVNVAYNADQAKRVFFAKFKARLARWGWLAANYNVLEAGRRTGTWKPGRPIVEINDDHVLFPRDIRAFSRHAQNESYEGLNIIAWVMDEASAFLSKLKRENAHAIYNTLRSSARTRFKRRWVGFIISYPRHGDDFTMEKIAEAERGQPGLYGSGPHPCWDVNLMYDGDERVDVGAGKMVPVSLAPDYQDDPDDARAKYECDPPAAVDALIKYPERLWKAVATGRKPLIEWHPTVTRRTVEQADGTTEDREFVGVAIDRLGKLPKTTKLYFHGDPASTSDAFALAFGHAVPATVMRKLPAGKVMAAEQLQARFLDPDELIDWEVDVNKTVIDALIVWRPDPRRRRPVDLLNVKEVLLQLCRPREGGYRIAAGSFDHYESAETVQALQAKRVVVENEMWSNPFQVGIYKNARSCFYNDLVSLPDDPTITSKDPRAPGALYELERVELIEARKVDHPEGGSKDLADAVVRVIEHVTGAAASGFVFGTAYGHQQAYPGKASEYAPSSERKVDPKRSPSPTTPTLLEQERLRQASRPPGELTPDTPRPPRKLGFGSANRR